MPMKGQKGVDLLPGVNNTLTEVTGARMAASFGSESEFLSVLLDHVSDCVVAVDSSGRIIFINRPYCRLLGGNPEDYLGRHVTEAISPDSKLHLVAAGGSPVLGEPLTVRGHKLITRQVPIKLRGEVIGAIGVALFRDIKLAIAFSKELAQEGAHIRGNSWGTRYTISDFVGNDPRVAAVRTQVLEVAQFDLPVLLSGETGTGKEIVAQSIHHHSARQRQPFIALNCATIPKELVESELFGYEGGAFTGARTRGAVGRFEMANGGTIFLDEIGEMPLSAQASLLRVIQERQIVRVGGTRQIPIDVRIICATNQDLRKSAALGRFRADLLYRIDVLRIDLPPLRERSDLAYLVRYIVERTASRLAVPTPSISEGALAELEQYAWPGNVRELENVATKAILECAKAERNDIRSFSLLRASTGPGMRPSSHVSPSLQARKEAFERDIIRAALGATGGRIAAAAEQLGISRVGLYKKVKRYGLLTAPEIAAKPGVAEARTAHLQDYVPEK
jgi:transcriptional regulator with PAS, ATPase and Fis domain